MNTRRFQRSFAGGEVTPELFGRIDDVKFQTGAARVRNMIVKPTGPVVRRPGFAFVGEAKQFYASISSVDAGTDTITLAATHSFPAGAQVWIELIGGATIPGGLVARTIYYVTNPSGATLQLAATSGGTALPISSAGSGTRRLHYENTTARLLEFEDTTAGSVCVELGSGYARFYADGSPVTLTGTPAALKTPKTVNGINNVTETFTTSAAHGFSAADPVRFSLSENNIVAGTTYYVIAAGLTATDFRVSETVGGTAFNITGAASGTQRVQYAYTAGDFVSSGGSNYIHKLEQVDDGTPSYPWWDYIGDRYEVVTDYAGSAIAAIRYVQSNDVLTLVHPDYRAAELRRYGANDWRFVDVEFDAPISAPTSPAVAATSAGIYLSVLSATLGNDEIAFAQAHGLVDGDTVAASGMTGAGIGNGDYIVTRTAVGSPSTAIKLKTIAGGTLVDITTTTANTGTITPVSPSHVTTNYYKVTAVNSDGAESAPTNAVSVASNLFVTGSYNTVTWSAPVTGTAVRYRVYKAESGLYGYIGETELTSFRDDNIAPDLSITPPIVDTTLENSGYYPGSVAYFEQRRCFAGSTNEPQSLYMTRSGTESDMAYSLPTRDDDRISVQVAARRNNRIMHIVPMQDMILLTSSAEWRVTSVNSDAITPTSIAVRPQSYIGSSDVQPLVTNSTIIFAAARGGHVREMGYRSDVQGYVVGDLSLRASHLFDGLSIASMAQGKAPFPILWFVSSNGYLLGCTYIPEHEVGAWHWHDTDGLFKSVAVLAEDEEDRLYAIVRRVIGGVPRNYVERMGAMDFGSALSSAFFVDSGIVSTGTTISGLTHLEGESVAVLQDGVTKANKTVASGAVTLAAAATVVAVGLPFTSQLQSLPLTLDIDGFGQGRQKNVNKVWVRVFESAAFEVGPATDQLVSSDPYTTPTTIYTGEVPVTVMRASWGDGAQVYVQQDDPLPLTVLGLTIEVAIGG